MKQKFDIITSTCVPLPLENVDTDQIIPARFLKATTREEKFFGDNLFRDWRYNPDGSLNTQFVLNDPTYGGQILVAGKNFGSGSSREHAAICPMYLGVKAVIAMSIERIHSANLVNFGILPLNFVNPADYDKIEENDAIIINHAPEQLTVGGEITATVKKADGSSFEIKLCHHLSAADIDIIRAGGMLNCTDN